MPGRLKFFTLALCIPILVVLLIHARNNLSQMGNTGKNTPAREMDLYLPEADYLKFISLGHDGLIADLVLAKALSYYGAHYKERRQFRFRHLEKLFETAVRMDPRNVDAFLIAGNTLCNVRVQSAIKMLQLGMTFHPRLWKFPEMIGFYYFFHLNDPYNAGKYYELAASLPGHPPYVPSLSGKFYQESGRYEEAVRVLNNFYTTTDDKRLKKSFADSIRAVEERIEKKNFKLNARCLQVISPTLIRFRPDKGNPQFQSLADEEMLTITGLDGAEPDSTDPREKLNALLQLEYCRYNLTNRPVRIRFLRNEDGSLSRNNRNHLQGTLFIENQPFTLPTTRESAPQAMDLDLKQSGRMVNRIVNIRFRVHHVSSDETAVYLNSAAESRNIFRAAVPQEYLKNFPDSPACFHRLKRKLVTVLGFAKIAHKRIQIDLFFPEQLSF